MHETDATIMTSRRVRSALVAAPSKRAGQQLRTLGLVTADESAGVQKVLTAAALTYVAGALAALTQLLYFVLAYLRD